MNSYQKNIIDNLDVENKALIPNQLARVGEIFNFVKGRYTLVGSVSGVGKTAFVDDSLILKPYEWVKSTNSPLHFEVLYISMERQARFKHAKFTSWKIYKETGYRLDADTILKNNPFRKLTTEDKTLIKSYQPWAEEMLDSIDLKDGIKTVEEISGYIEYLRQKLGTLFKTDDNHLYKEDEKILNLFHRKASFNGEFKQSKRGKIPIISFTYRDKKYEIQKNSKLFIPHNPDYIVSILIDHIGKTSTKGFTSKKLALDALDEVLCTARDLYNFNPIPISQFNRSLSDPTRLKYSKGNLEPMYEDFKDTGNFVESADLILSVFNPYKYQSYDEKGFYKGYDIKGGMLTPNGDQRFRSLHIIKHSFGSGEISFGLKFIGESMYFSTLPRPDDLIGLQKIYTQIATE